MRIEAKVQKWGNGLGLRVSGAMREIPHLQEGTLLDIEINEDGFTATKHEPERSTNLPFTEAELLHNLDADLAHADIIASPLSDEWPEE